MDITWYHRISGLAYLGYTHQEKKFSHMYEAILYGIRVFIWSTIVHMVHHGPWLPMVAHMAICERFGGSYGAIWTCASTIVCYNKQYGHMLELWHAKEDHGGPWLSAPDICKIIK